MVFLLPIRRIHMKQRDRDLIRGNFSFLTEVSEIVSHMVNLPRNMSELGIETLVVSE